MRHIKAGDRIRVVIETTVETAKHFDHLVAEHSDGSAPQGQLHGFTALTFNPVRYVGWKADEGLKESSFTIEIPDHTDYDTTIEIEVYK